MNIFLRWRMRPKEGDSILYRELWKEKVIDFTEMEKIRAVRWRIIETVKKNDSGRSMGHQEGERVISAFSNIVAISVATVFWIATLSLSYGFRLLGGVSVATAVTALVGYILGWDLYIRAFFRRLREKNWKREPILTEDVTDHIAKRLSTEANSDIRMFGTEPDLGPTNKKLDELEKESQRADERINSLQEKHFEFIALMDSGDYPEKTKKSLEKDLKVAEKKYFLNPIAVEEERIAAAWHHRNQLYIVTAEVVNAGKKLTVPRDPENNDDKRNLLEQARDRARMFRSAKHIGEDSSPGVRLTIPPSMEGDVMEIKAYLQELKGKVDQANKLAERSTEELYEERKQKKEQQSKEKQAEEETRTTE